MINVLRRFPSTFAILLFTLLAAVDVAAFQLVPMSAVIDPAASSPTAVFSITNGNAQPIAVQLRAATRRILADGTEINDDATAQLQVFPSQLVVRPGTTQTVRVRWIGQTAPTRELPFRLIAEQLPINLSRENDENSGVQFMLRYRATVYVRPSGVSPRLTVTGLSVDETVGTVTITVENSGTEHRSFPEGRVLLARDGEEQVLPMSEIEPFITVNVLPGETRRIVVPLDLLPFPPERVSFQFDR